MWCDLNGREFDFLQDRVIAPGVWRLAGKPVTSGKIPYVCITISHVIASGVCRLVGKPAPPRQPCHFLYFRQFMNFRLAQIHISFEPARLFLLFTFIGLIMSDVADKIKKVEAPLVAVFTSAGLKPDTIGKLSDAGIVTMSLFCHICTDADSLRVFLEKGVGLDLKDFKGDFLEAAKVIGPGRTLNSSGGP